jgi:hypothetical protein
LPHPFGINPEVGGMTFEQLLFDCCRLRIEVALSCFYPKNLRIIGQTY